MPITSIKSLVLASLLVGLLAPAVQAQSRRVRSGTSATAQSGTLPVDPTLINGLRWRNIGPFRAGRSLAVAGHPDHPQTYYFGATGGGVWKTVNGGASWACVSDSVFQSSSVGAITVAPSDPNVIYVGMGEAEIRSNISYGDGVYKSTDGGKSWRHMGLKQADAIGNIEVHPQNPNLIYAAALGNPFAPNAERGVFRSTDGGATWSKVLFKNDSTGAATVRLDPSNPSIVYATLWQAYRNGHSMSSGGPGCGLYKSTDGGTTWQSLNEKPGMPRGLLGKIGLAVAPSNGNRLYALIENAKGGLYRSDDGGEHWSLLNDDKNLWQRPWYYMMLGVSPQNENDLIVLNVNALRSRDGGKTFSRVPVHHGDTHDVWFNPKNPMNFAIADDGGAEITFDGGNTFSDIAIPTAQFYHVSLDNDFPYNVYGAQQDNSSIRIASRTDGYSIGQSAWYPVAGGEAGYIAADPKDPKITFGGEYDGFMSKHDARTNQTSAISVYPEGAIGAPASVKKYRFQWTYPILFSPHDPSVLYATSNHVHRSTDAGHSWEDLSPDLTRHEPKTIGETGGPITKDMTGAEIYATIFTFAEAPTEKGVFWAGSDDGLLHVSRDGGKTWQNVSLPVGQLPEFALMSLVHPSEHAPGKAYLAANRYMSGDRKPYLYKTTDYGKTWTPITNGILADEYCRVVRDDPEQPGLLFAGTERGIYVSFNDGANWQRLNQNLPISPIRDLQIHKREKDLVVATHGRSFWIMDDITPLRELARLGSKSPVSTTKPMLFAPRHAYRMLGGNARSQATEGENAENGVLVRYFLPTKPTNELRLQFLTAKGDTIISYSDRKDKKGKPLTLSKEFYEDVKLKRPGTAPALPGLNQFVWDMRYPDAVAVEGTNVMWSGDGVGVKVTPGRYRVRLLLGDSLVGEQPIEIRKDPRLPFSEADYAEQFAFVKQCNDKLSEAHRGINQLRAIRASVNSYMGTLKDSTVIKKFTALTKPMLADLDALEATLMQPKAKAPQDVLAHPIRLNDKLAGLASMMAGADGKPTKAAHVVYTDLARQIDAALAKLKDITGKQVPAFNQLVSEQKLPAIVVDSKGF
ncbi:glycosyl hydrolase, BNR repeat-containing protein [Fibrella aestuarina BUZ 2]|uniref:Glycosyl hydrolase, BNR repeat-containing protein n=1 Tax=Fibrella aestuarina BUZ 2 TaxID=1166018 RepID=I0KAA2_9BACT|nr:sialidase family protein [Fibrella aestuarina]CCH01055.1 glycosyl hydrolase, BNR repeat-containing protein [Fibrella aestuarina BUZ 2]